jgi:hypothetical protein
MKTRMVIATIACVTLAAGVVWMAVTWQARRTDPAEPVAIQVPAPADDAKPTGGLQLVFDPPPADETTGVESALVKPADDEAAPAVDDEPKPADQPPGRTERMTVTLDKGELAEVATLTLDKGLAALADYDLLKARSLLSQAVLSGGLSPDNDAKARDQLTQLVETTLWSAQVIEGDPYTYHYPVKSGETLVRIERGEQLYVPTELLVKVNRLRDATALAAGKNVKLVRGPFHAVIRKSDFTMDIFLHREGLEKIWITRLPVGTGRDGSTPEGLFQVGDLKQGVWRPGKLVRPTWTPTESSELRGPIVYGQSGYALGTKGLWIGLAGLDDNTRPLTDYALHSTDMPNSIGKEMSSGCVRLADTDIDTAWNLLYEQWSTVRIVK